MKSYSTRDFVVEFPDDGGVSLAAVVRIAGKGGTSVSLDEWLLHCSDYVMAVHTRISFPDLRVTQDGQLIVPDDDRQAVESWVGVQARGQSAWTHLEVVTPWSLGAARNWGAAYHQVLCKRPRVRSMALWPHVFFRR
jgi:hypothetical protein